MVVRTAIHGLDVDVGARAASEALEEVRHQFGLKVAHEAGANLGVNGEGGTAAQVYGCNREGFVHRHEEVPGTQDAALVAQGAIKSLAERDAHVFDGVVLVDVKVAAIDDDWSGLRVVWRTENRR